jgi:uncharacterized protein (TIGR02145 family)
VAESRTATVTIAAGTLTKAVTVTQAAAEAVLTVDETPINAPAAGNNYPIAVASNAAWTASVNSAATAWVSLTSASATGNGTVTVNVSVNPDITSRAATVTITAGTLTRSVTIEQAAGDAALTVDETPINVTATAGSYPVAVTSNLSWTAAVDAAATWVSLTDASATGNGTVTVNAATNPIGSSREATITITAGTITRTVTVTQEAAVLSTEGANYYCAATAWVYDMVLTGNLPWTATLSNPSASSWCTVTPSSGAGNDTVKVSITDNNDVVYRAVTINFAAGSLTASFLITQVEPPPTLTLDKTAISATAAAGSYPIAVTSNAIWGVASSAPGWCTVSPASGSRNGTVNVTVTANPTVATRAATVTIAAGTVTKTVGVTQAAGNATLTVDKTTISATAAAGSYPIAVASNVVWAAVSSATGWCTVSPASGNGNATVNVTVTENAAASRVATVTITSGTLTRTITVMQAEGAPKLTVDKTNISASNAAGSYPIAVTSNTVWAAVSSATGWCTVSPASGSGKGTVNVTVTANAAASRTATVTISSGTLMRTVTVTQAGVATPQYAATTNAWAVGSQVWSDAIQLPACDKSDFAYDVLSLLYPISDCRSYSLNGKHFYYSWLYVNEHKDQLCPSPWRVPTRADFEALLNAQGVGSDHFYNPVNWIWGGTYAGYATASINDISSLVYYWSSTESTSGASFTLGMSSNYKAMVTDNFKSYGMPVRCVK